MISCADCSLLSMDSFIFHDLIGEPSHIVQLAQSMISSQAHAHVTVFFILTEPITCVDLTSYLTLTSK